MTDRQDNLRNVIRKVLAQRYKCITTFHKLYEHFYFQRLRKRNKNTDFSLFSPNCYAGLIYHRLGLQFQSPTINMLFPSKKEYLKFVSNLNYYLSLELEEIKDERFPYPAGVVGDVELVFNHYSSFQEANEAWIKRKERINYDNVFMIFDDIADAEYEDLIKFNSIPCRGKVILTAKEYPDLENVVQISKYKKDHIMRPYLMERNQWTGKCPADKDFVFVSWLNKE